MNIDELQLINYQMVEAHKGQKDIYSKIDMINECDFEMPASLKQLSWIGNRKFATTAPKNALQGATRTFASHLPYIDIYPMTEGIEEWNRVEALERAMEWNFDLLCSGGEQSAHWQIVDNAMKYCAAALQVEYLPYALRGRNEPKYRDAKRRSPFRWIVHNPGNVRRRYNKYGVLECVLLADVRTVQDLIDEFGMSNPGVAALMSKLATDMPGAKLHQTYVQFYDYTDYSERAIYVALNGNNKAFVNIEAFDQVYVIMNEKHGLDFINWVIVDNKEPLLKPLIDAEVWDNANILMTIEQSMFIALAGHPRFWTNTISGKGVKLDYNDPTNKADLKMGETIGTLKAPEIDPGLRKAVEEIEKQIYESTAPRVLSSAEQLAAKGAAFSTINAIIQLSISQLSLAKMTAERAEAEAIYLMFRWIAFSDVPLITFRADVQEDENPQVTIVPGPRSRNASKTEVNFDLDKLFIKVTLKPQTLVDEAGRLNNAVVKYENLGISQLTALEEVGVKHANREVVARTNEDKRRQKQGLPPLGRNDMFPAAQGIKTDKGNISAQAYNPGGMTREARSGKTKSGDEIVN